MEKERAAMNRLCTRVGCVCGWVSHGVVIEWSWNVRGLCGCRGVCLSSH